MIEVELRSFLTGEQYTRIQALLDAEGELLENTNQETWYFDQQSCLRLMRGDEKAKICLKGGTTHDEWREEVDLPIALENVEAARALLRGMGHQVEARWIRHRRRYMWHGIDVALDDTKGHGQMLELELLVEPGAEEPALERLRATFKELDIIPSSREEFERRYSDYMAHWRERIGE